MGKLQELLNGTDLEQSAKDVIVRVLNQLDEKIVKSFIENLKIINRRVAGTYYKEVKENLSSADFISLYEALGYDFAQEDHWFDYTCDGKKCIDAKWATCDTQRCFPQ